MCPAPLLHHHAQLFFHPAQTPAQELSPFLGPSAQACRVRCTLSRVKNLARGPGPESGGEWK